MEFSLRDRLERIREARRIGACYKLAAREMRSRGNAVALTGAGISVDSGIPDFRDEGGLWQRFDPMEYAHINSFRKHPEKTWQLLRELYRIVKGAEPNAGHLGLGRLEELGLLRTVITQNVDGLHQRAGNRHVIEYHGSHRELVCLDCGKRYCAEELHVDATDSPPRCECGAVLKPDVVLFGEAIPVKAHSGAKAAVRHCRVMLVVGTSAMVYPASELPEEAKLNGALIIEINTHKTPLTDTVTDIFLQGSASVVFPRLVSSIEGLSRRFL